MNIQELLKQQEATHRAIQDYTDKAEAEKRALTEEELKEVDGLQRKYKTLQAQIEVAQGSIQYNRNHEYSKLASAIRSVVSRQSVEEVVDMRSAIPNASTTTSMAGAAHEETIGIINPLNGGHAARQLGIQIRTDLTRGGKWAKAEDPIVEIEGEAVDLGTKKLNMTKKSTAPKRAAIKVLVTNEAMDMADIELITQVVIPGFNRAFERFLDLASLSTTDITGGLKGVFNTDGVNKVTFKAAVPTYAELLSLRGKVLAAGAVNDGTFGYVMSAEMHSVLCATPREKGDSRMIIENNMIDGLPVVISQNIENGNAQLAQGKPKYVGFGMFHDGIFGIFGKQRLTIDDKSVAAASVDGTWVVFNTHVDVAALHEGAFALGTATVA